MARKINITSGSILNGSPITFSILPQIITGKDSDGNTVYPSFHRVIVEVKCGLNTGSYETIKMSSPVEQEKDGLEVSLDISSALRVLRDSYEYSSNPTSYPYVSFNVKAYDEYMLNGEVKTNQGIVYYPSETDYMRTIFGTFPDIERLTSSGSKSVRTLTRRPTSMPHAACVGEKFAYTPSYNEEKTLANSSTLIGPTSQVVEIEKEGLQNIDGRLLFALPSEEARHRTIFRFINSYGVLESLSVPKSYSHKFSVATNTYVISRQETFNKFSRAAIKKQNDQESWLFISDPLNEEWVQWYLHEFMMSEHVWMQINDTFIPCIITSDDEITIMDKTNNNMLSVLFTAKLDINGSPYV